ncbi:MAG: hypothetical protein QF704_16575, partial [Anaerolineales bacterium]|nr:hypothetical protein [Anaerolineales bacterium]
QIMNTLDDAVTQTHDIHNNNILQQRSNLLKQLNTTPTQIKRIVQKYINPSNIVSVMLGPVQNNDT